MVRLEIMKLTWLRPLARLRAPYVAGLSFLLIAFPRKSCVKSEQLRRQTGPPTVALAVAFAWQSQNSAIDETEDCIRSSKESTAGITSAPSPPAARWAR